MPRKRYPKLPNGYGQIRYLGKKRRNPYGVYPPAIYDDDGKALAQKAICYVDSWLKGFEVLTSYKAGTYTPGDEKDLKIDECANPDSFIQKLLSDYNRMQGLETETDEKGFTFAEVYEKFWNYKYETEKGKKLSQQSRYSTQAAFKNCSVLHDKEFALLKHDELQRVIDDCPLKHASVELIVSLFKQMYDFAEIYDLCEKNCARHVKINIEDDDESGVPFTDDELKILWNHIDDPTIEMIIIMCYSGYRITAYKTLKIDLEKKSFFGGLKTKAGRKRTVPIHSGIYSLVKKRIERDGEILKDSTDDFRIDMYDALEKLGIEKHTPHDCRHTFSKLCDDFEVKENDKKRMLGHAFNDVTNKVYGHRSLEALRTEIEKIKICCKLVVNE